MPTPLPLTQAPAICLLNPVSGLIDVVTGAVTSAGVTNAFFPIVLNANGLLDPSLTNTGLLATANTNLNQGKLVNLFYAGSVLTMRYANAASGSPLPATGFIYNAVASGAVGTVSTVGQFIFQDALLAFTANDVGVEVFLSTDGLGDITKVSPVAPNLIQSIGYVIAFQAGTPNLVTVAFATGFRDFAQLSGVAQVNQGGTGATTGAQALINLGMSVAVAVPAEFTVSGSPIQNAGTITIAKANEGANKIWAGPVSGAAAAPTFRSTVPYDINSGVNAQSLATYTFLDSDKFKLVTFNLPFPYGTGSFGTGAFGTNLVVAATLPQAGAGGQFLAGWSTFVTNLGNSDATITPTVSQINGSTSPLVLAAGQSAIIWSDGTNYSAIVTGTEGTNLRSSSSLINATTLSAPITVNFSPAMSDNNYTVVATAEVGEAIATAGVDVVGVRKLAAGGGVTVWVLNNDSINHNVTVHVRAIHD